MPERIKSELLFTDLPEGTVTFLFTDIEGSTLLLRQLGADRYGQVLVDQRRLLRAVFAHWQGQEIDTQGDAFFVAFPRATQAVSATVEIQRALEEHQWPEDVEVRVRMGLHTGEPLKAEEGYVGMDVHRAARIAHVGYGGQVLLSETTTALAMDELPEGVSLLDLGRHLLKDMHRPEHIRQLVVESLPCEFSPLTSLEHLPPIELREPRQVRECPYRGLAAFREDDAPFFYGREAFTERLFEAVRTQPMVAVIVGSSGSGKSSAVFAGLLPGLRESGGWEMAVFRPGAEPFQALGSALLPLLETELSETDRLAETRKLADRIMVGEVVLFQVVERLLEVNPHAKQILLVIDQFEELYTLCSDVEIQRRFINELLAAVDKASTRRLSPLVILLTMRADFMGQALTHRPFADALQEASLIMGPMTREELQAAIEKPAEVQGAAFEPGLVERILDDVGQEPGNLPLLEFALTLLWERQSDGWLTHEDYEALGWVEGALAAYADEVYAELDEHEREAAHRIFVQLVRPGEGTEDTRRVATFEELGEAYWGLIQHLADKRLVVTGRDAASGDETVEVVHEALIQRWDRLREWMETDRAFRTWQERLRASLRGWEASDQDEGALLRGAPLAEAEEWLDNRGAEIGAAEQEYIQTSAAFQEKRRAQRERRRKLILSGLAAGLVVALLLSVFAFSQRSAAEQNAALANQSAATAQAESLARATQQSVAEAESISRATQQAVAEAERARAEGEAYARATQQALVEEHIRVASARSLSAIALEKLPMDPQLGLLLALQAADLTYTVDGSLVPEAETALHQAVKQAARLLLTIPAQEQSLPYVSFSPDGSRLVTQYFPPGSDPRSFPKNTITRIWDASTGDLITTLAAGIVPDQWPQRDELVTLNLVGGSGLQANIWNTSDGTKISESKLDLPFNINLGEIKALTVSPDMQHIALSWDFGKRFGIWNLSSGDEIMNVITGGPQEPIGVVGGGAYLYTMLPSYLAFSPDAENLVSLHEALGSGSEEDIGIMTFRDTDTAELLSSHYFFYDYQPFRILSLSRDGKLVAAAAEGQISIRNRTSWQEIALLVGSGAGSFSTLVFNPDSRLLAAASPDGTIRIWDVNTSILTNSSQLLSTLQDPGLLIHDLSFSPDGTRLASAANDGSIKIWDIRPGGGAELPSIINPLTPEDDHGTLITLSPDGSQLATVSVGEAPTIWDTASRAPLFLLTTQGEVIKDLAYSPDGAVLATCSQAGPLVFWDVESGQKLLTLDGYTEAGCALDFHQERGALALGFFRNDAGWYQVLDLPDMGQDSLVPFDLEIPIPWRGGRDGEITQLDFSHDGSQLASTNSQREFYIWDPWLEDSFIFTSDGALDLSILMEEGRNYHDVDCSPIGDNLVTGGVDGLLTIWDTKAMEILHAILAHNGKVNVVAYDLGGERVATGGTDRSIKIWDVETGQELMTLYGHNGAVTDLAFSPDGRYLYSAGEDSAVRMYLLDIDKLISMAQSRVFRSLTDEECRRYLHLDTCPETPLLGN